MIPPSFRAWLTSIGGVIVLNTDQLFIAKLDGATAVPGYRAAYLVFLNLAMVSVAVAGASSVFVSHLWEARQYDRVRRLVQRNLRFGLSLILCGGAAALILGRRLFALWLGPGHFVGYPILLTFFALLTLETQAFIISTSSRATEDEAFAPCALIAAVLKVAFAFVLGSALGLLGIALSTLFAQLLTNHWFMMCRGLRRLEISLLDHAKKVLAPMGILLATITAALWLSQQATSALPDWLIVGCGLLAAAAVFAAGLWILVFDDSDRTRIWNLAASIVGRPRPRLSEPLVPR
jgi:O-antigen/teichoic acid export membrane protein